MKIDAKLMINGRSIERDVFVHVSRVGFGYALQTVLGITNISRSDAWKMDRRLWSAIIRYAINDAAEFAVKSYETATGEVVESEDATVMVANIFSTTSIAWSSSEEQIADLLWSIATATDRGSAELDAISEYASRKLHAAFPETDNFDEEDQRQSFLAQVVTRDMSGVFLDYIAASDIMPVKVTTSMIGPIMELIRNPPHDDGLDIEAQIFSMTMEACIGREGLDQDLLDGVDYAKATERVIDKLDLLSDREGDDLYTEVNRRALVQWSIFLSILLSLGGEEDA